MTQIGPDRIFGRDERGCERGDQEKDHDHEAEKARARYAERFAR